MTKNIKYKRYKIFTILCPAKQWCVVQLIQLKGGHGMEELYFNYTRPQFSACTEFGRKDIIFL